MLIGPKFTNVEGKLVSRNKIKMPIDLIMNQIDCFRYKIHFYLGLLPRLWNIDYRSQLLVKEDNFFFEFDYRNRKT